MIYKKPLHFSQLTRDGDFVYVVDGYDERTSSWIRWINCSRHVKEQNVLMVECRGKIFYVTIKDVHPGEELLHYYGDEDAQNLDIKTEFYYDMDVDINLYKKFACWNLWLVLNKTFASGPQQFHKTAKPI